MDTPDSFETLRDSARLACMRIFGAEAIAANDEDATAPEPERASPPA